MVKLKFWSIYSHIETSVIKIMRDIHANTLFVVKCSKKAPSQAKWWDLSDLHIQNIGEIDKIWVSVKIWIIQYNLSELAHFVSEYIRNLLESSHPARHHSYLAVQCSRPRAQNLVERKTKWAIRNMGKHRNFGSRRLCCHVDRHYYVIMGWWHVVTTGTGQWSVTRSVVTRPIVRWPAPMGWPVPELPVPHNGPSLYAGLNWPQSSATCHREHHAKQKPLKPRTKNN